MSLDRPIGEKERRGDLLVRPAERDERSDTLLCRRERAGSRRAPADALQLGSGALRPERCADSLEDGERLLERRSRFASPLQPPLRGAEREQRTTAVERELDLCVPVERASRTRPARSRAHPPARRGVPRQRAQLASAETRPSRLAFPSYQSRSSRASRDRPSSTSASMWSTTNRVAPGSTIPSRRTTAVCDARCSTTSLGRSSERARSPRAADATRTTKRSESRLDDVRRSLPGGFRPTALCLSETLERACAQREQEQTRLLGGLMSLAGAREARLDVSEQQLELAEEEEEPGPRALVTQLVGAAQEIRESGTRLVVRVDPGPVLSERAEWLVQNANACRRCLEGERLLCCRGRRCPSEQRLRAQSRQLHIGRERQIAHLGGERQRDVGVPQLRRRTARTSRGCRPRLLRGREHSV